MFATGESQEMAGLASGSIDIAELSGDGWLQTMISDRASMIGMLVIEASEVAIAPDESEERAHSIELCELKMAGMLRWFRSSASFVASSKTPKSDELERSSLSTISGRFSEETSRFSVISIAAFNSAKSEESDGSEVSLIESTLETELTSCLEVLGTGVEVAVVCFLPVFGVQVRPMTETVPVHDLLLAWFSMF